MDEDIRGIEASEYFRDWREDIISRLKTVSVETLSDELQETAQGDVELVDLEGWLELLAEQAKGDLDTVETQQDAEYMAARAYDREYAAAMTNPHAPGKASMREDFALSNASAVYNAKLREYGYDPSECAEPHGAR